MGSRIAPASVILAFALVGLAACHDSGPVSPTPSQAASPVTNTGPATPPTRIAVTFRLRSGGEGLPPLPGATVYIDGRSAVTDREGRLTIDDVAVPTAFHIDAGAHWSYRGMAVSAATDLVLWPRDPGEPAQWLALSSFSGPDYNSALWRPAADIELRLEGRLADAPARAVWDAAVREVAGAIESAGSSAPTIRLGVDATATPVRQVNAQPCEVVRWELTPPFLTPPPTMPLSDPRASRDAEFVLGRISELVGFRLESSRRLRPYSGGALAPWERTAIRMRMLRTAGAGFGNDMVEDATGTTAEPTLDYFCR